MPFQFFTLHLLWVMAIAGLNITGGRADDVMPWLLMVTGILIVDSSFIMGFHSLRMHTNWLLSH